MRRDEKEKRKEARTKDATASRKSHPSGNDAGTRRKKGKTVSPCAGRKGNRHAGREKEEERKKTPAGRRRRKAGRRRSPLDRLTVPLIAVAVFMLVFSGMKMAGIMNGYHGVDEANKAAERIADKGNVEEGGKAKRQEADPMERTVNFDALRKVNSDVVAWIYIPGTAVNYPVMKGDPGNYYLHRSWKRQKSFGGAIFMDSVNSHGFTDDNTIVYGHNMKNGSQFGTLIRFLDGKFFESHPYVYVYTPERTIRYRTYAFDIIDERSPLYASVIDDYPQYVKDVTKSARHSRRPPDEKTPLLMLSTCHGKSETKRRVLFAGQDAVRER